MELARLEGGAMLLVGMQPWRVRRIGRQPRDLHLRLRGISLDEASADDRAALAHRVGGGNTLVHDDLRPGNVMVTPVGPVVLDWSNGGVGPADADAAVTWLLLTVGDPGDESRVMRALIFLLRVC